MIWLAVFFTGSLVFDLTVLIGTVYLVEERMWSAWWFVLSILVCQAQFQGVKTLLGLRDE